MAESKFKMCRIDKDGIYLPKKFIEQVLEDFNMRLLEYNEAGNMFAVGRLVGGMDVYGELLDKINKTEA